MTTEISKTHDTTVKVVSDDEQVIIEIPADYVAWSINPRGDLSYITLKKVEL